MIDVGVGSGVWNLFFAGALKMFERRLARRILMPSVEGDSK
jgi:hypothetical protein